MMIRQKGITILETLLVLVLGALIITMAVRYFFISERSMRMEQAVTQIRHLTQASYQWLSQNRVANFGGPPGINISSLVKADLIQAKEQIDPWGGAVTVEPGGDNAYVTITLNNLPKLACIQLKHQLQYTSRTNTTTCVKRYNNKYVGEF